MLILALVDSRLEMNSSESQVQTCKDEDEDAGMCAFPFQASTCPPINVTSTGSGFRVQQG
jgi:hypothetical protein